MKPMLAKIGDESLLKRPGYIYEPKLDGIRALLSIDKTMRLQSRNGIDLSERFSTIKVPTIHATSCIIDGELVAYDDKGIPDFNCLQNNAPAVYVAFDILEKNGKSLRGKPLMERKRILQETLRENKTVQLMVYTEKGTALWSLIKKRGGEGVIAKRKEGVYQEGVRTDSWMKIKIKQTIDAIIVGYTGVKRNISSLALGLYENNHIVFIGKVGTGFDESFMELFWPRLLKIRTQKAIPGLPRAVQAVLPRFVAEVEYLEFTTDRRLRVPVFKRLRDDKDVTECTFPA